MMQVLAHASSNDLFDRLDPMNFHRLKSYYLSKSADSRGLTT
uniref:Uncharacterized protein n=1 Tax=Rhizophora mucronata TaxID=61149 RepID=A0A2P2P5H7_RHIMU